MRIGIITGEYPPMQGGVGAYSQILARKIVSLGHSVFVFTHSVAAPDERLTITPAVKKWGFGAILAARRWADENRLNVVNIQYQTVAYAMSPYIHALPNVIRRVPVVTTFHDLRHPYLFPKAGALRDWAVMHLARASDGCIVTNHEDAARLAALPRVTLIPIGSNITARVPADFDAEDWRAKAGASPGDFLIAYFGFANRSKGLGVLVEAIARLRSEGVPAQLVMIGGRTGTSDPTNAAYADEIAISITRLNLTPHVHQTGFVDEESVAFYIASSDVVALPFLDGASFRRGTLMAAIHHGCAIVSTHPAVPIPEFVNGENMLFVPPNDADSLAAALRRLYESPGLRQHLRAGVAALAPRFDWTHIAGDTVAFFERLGK